MSILVVNPPPPRPTEGPSGPSSAIVGSNGQVLQTRLHSPYFARTFICVVLRFDPLALDPRIVQGYLIVGNTSSIRSASDHERLWFKAPSS
jgi:hypothetical protein